MRRPRRAPAGRRLERGVPRIVPVVLCGGSGTRLWPLSRALLPKQFLPLAGERTLVQEAALRARALPGAHAPVFVANQEHRFLLAEQLRAAAIEAGALLLEPVARNTAAAIAAAACYVAAQDPQAVLLVFPSDHRIGRPAAFRRAALTAARLAQHGHLVTFGITPDRPATGYGWIEVGDAVPGARAARRILRFVEKPSAARARRFLASGRFLWNSGMFAFRVQDILAELQRFAPAVRRAAETAVAQALKDLDFLRLGARAFARAPALSIDHAVMEHTRRGVVLPAPFAWSDIGSWRTLWEIGPRDQRGNVVRGDVRLNDVRGCYVRANARHVSLIGVRDLVVVETEDALLVAARDRAEEVREAVARLAREGRGLEVSHRRVHRPWGYYESVDAGPGFQVKRLFVKPGGALSLQRHARRAEHWVVVSGVARVTRGPEVSTLGPNESTFVPAGVTHRLENAGPEPLQVVEVQSGAYLGEDDIERLDDRYGRTPAAD